MPLCCQESHHGTGLYLTLTSFLCWDFSAQKAKKNAALKRIRTSCYLDFQNTPLEELNVSVKASTIYHLMKVKHIKRMMCGTKGSDCSSVLAPQPALTCFKRKTFHQPCSLDVTRKLDREKFRFTSDTLGISPILSFLWVLSLEFNA